MDGNSAYTTDTVTHTDNCGTQFCRFCGKSVSAAATFCTSCGKNISQQSNVQTQLQPQIIINNANNNTNTNMVGGFSGMRRVDKWIAFFLCLLLGFVGAHKFYEGRTGIGIIYLFTCGLFGIGWFIDCIAILLKPNPYYV